MLGLFLAAVDQTIVSTALPTIVSEFGGIERIHWVAVAYVLTSTASTPLYGKVSDLFGRRPIFQFATVVFLCGSILSGLSGSLFQLVLFRGLQGIGGGGLMAMAFTIVADLLSPRERGRYMGYFTAVFAVAGVVGPLLGGFFVDQLSWRWIFYVNVPLGAVSLAVTSSVLRLPAVRREREIDYAGAVLLVGAVTCIVLLSAWGGDAYPWTSPAIFGLGAATAVLTTLFLARERRAAEPVVPLNLFRNPVVAVTVSMSFIVGIAMFGTLVFLPLFLQAVKGVSATASGLLLAPMTAGLTVASLIAGRSTTRTGRYKHWIVLGAGLVTLAMLLLARLHPTTTRLSVAATMVTLGFGLGTMLPILNLATQNAVPLPDLGIATTLVSFARSLGGSLGMAGFGAVLSAHLGSRLAELLVRAGLPPAADARSLTQGVAQIQGLAEPLRTLVVTSLSDAVAFVYTVAAPVAAIAFLLSWCLREIPLRGAVPASDTRSDVAIADAGIDG